MTKRKVLVPLDRSEQGKKILAEIEKLIQPQDTSIILFHVASIQKSIGIDVPSYEYESPGHIRTMHSPTRLPHPVYASQEEDAGFYSCSGLSFATRGSAHNSYLLRGSRKAFVLYGHRRWRAVDTSIFLPLGHQRASAGSS